MQSSIWFYEVASRSGVFEYQDEDDSFWFDFKCMTVDSYRDIRMICSKFSGIPSTLRVLDLESHRRTVRLKPSSMSWIKVHWWQMGKLTFLSRSASYGMLS